MLGLGILLLLVFVLGVPAMAIAALVRSGRLERELADSNRKLAGLSRDIIDLRTELRAARVAPAAEPAKPAAERIPVDAPAPVPEKIAVPPPPPVNKPEPAAKPVFTVPPPIYSPSDAARLEEALTSRWLIWLGAVAIALAGTFLVKYAIDNGILGPEVRVTLGFLLGLALAAAGEWLRQRPMQRAIAAIHPNYIPPALTASGLFVAFASIYAAYALYDLLPALFAFTVLAAIALLAVGLSLLQGPFVALLGLVCGFVTPALIATPNPSAFGLFAYLLVIEAACLAVVRYRGWWWLAVATLAGAAAWPLLWIVGNFWSASDELPVGLYLILTAVAFYAARWKQERISRYNDWLVEMSETDEAERLVWLAACAIAVVFLNVVRAADGSIASLALFAGLAVLYLAAGRRESVFDGLAAVAGATALAIVATMPLPDVLAAPSPYPSAPYIRPELQIFTYAAAGYAALFGIAGFIELWGARRPAMWAGVSAAVPALILTIAYWRIAHFEVDVQWTGMALGLAGLNLFAAERVERYRTARGLDVSLALYAAGVVALVSLGAAMSLRQAWLTVALSLQLPALAWVRGRVPVRALDILAGIVAVLVLIRLVLNYDILNYPIGDVPYISWVLYGYGIPAISFFAAARLFRKHRVPELVTVLEAGALVFFVLLVSLQIRVSLTGSLSDSVYPLLEKSLQSIVWLGIGTALVKGRLDLNPHVLFYGSRILLGLAAAQILVLQLLIYNPLFDRQFVGEYPLFDVLLLAYAAPAVFAFAVAAAMNKPEEENLQIVSAVTGFALVFIYISLEVRHLFQGPYLDASTFDDTEVYAYSAVWLAYAAILLGLGIRFGKTQLRYASLAVLLIVTAKVFLLDMSGLTGLLRVASFLGLGLSLVGIGYLYQRFVFRTPAPS